MGIQAPEPHITDLLTRVKRQLAKPSERGKAGSFARESVLLATAARYGTPVTDYSVTPPTGFDPEAAALFEAIVESAFLVANADGDFDATEREVFTLVVLEASDRRVSERLVQAIVLDLSTQLAQDGLDRRLEQVGRAVLRPSDRREALRIACLLARVSAGVSDVERAILERLAAVWDLSPDAVDEALSEVEQVLGGEGGS
jgi:tellurite resistance protein